ncbi:uncharacterized protein HKW66_Vig0257380 [Vigna angularis]|uniref:Myb-like domain-containing protein n=1 Tax=Phaseolus angularis TaxID=3914 RepID=A0A8T0JW31_PHAAN|nr:uncharacterized protein HKW66_Vig0257380 [Vigna angularis]
MNHRDYTVLMVMLLASIGIKYGGSNTNPFQYSTPTVLLFLTAICSHVLVSTVQTTCPTNFIFNVSGVVGCEALLWILIAPEFLWWYIINILLLLVASFCFNYNPLNGLSLTLATPPSTFSHRLTPSCWTPEETSALIDAYRDKWYSLGRTNLKATHWQEVADAVTAQCPNASATAKTAVQCRHKMEKLRKRYRTEIQCLRSLPLPRLINNSTTASPSSWVHFKSMDSMEKGPNKPHTDTTTATNPNTPTNNLNFPDEFQQPQFPRRIPTQSLTQSNLVGSSLTQSNLVAPSPPRSTL